jgi:hypothetical protein
LICARRVTEEDLIKALDRRCSPKHWCRNSACGPLRADFARPLRLPILRRTEPIQLRAAPQQIVCRVVSGCKRGQLIGWFRDGMRELGYTEGGAATCPELGWNGLHDRRSRSDASGLRPTFISDSIRVPERVAVHVLTIEHDTAPEPPRAATSIVISTEHHLQRVLHESLCMRLQRRQTRVEELPASEICSSSPEDALCGTHLLSQVSSVNPLPQQGQ